MEIKDSGERRKFESGAVRDIQEGKGRCDLLPLVQIGNGYEFSDTGMRNILVLLGNLLNNEETEAKEAIVMDSIKEFIDRAYSGDYETAFLELAKHYEEGAKKYNERNWQKGIPTHCYIDSGVRHLLKWKRGDKDEPHDRAFLWNMFGYIWTIENKPELDDYRMEDD